MYAYYFSEAWSHFPAWQGNVLYNWNFTWVVKTAWKIFAVFPCPSNSLNYLIEHLLDNRPLCLCLSGKCKTLNSDECITMCPDTCVVRHHLIETDSIHQHESLKLESSFIITCHADALNSSDILHKCILLYIYIEGRNEDEPRGLCYVFCIRFFVPVFLGTWVYATMDLKAQQRRIKDISFKTEKITLQTFGLKCPITYP